MTYDTTPTSTNSAPETASTRTPSLQPLPWASRLSGMPYLPGGSARQLDSLNSILQVISNSDGLLTQSYVDASGTERSLRDAVKPLTSTGLIEVLDRSHVSLTSEGCLWLQEQNPDHLLITLHRHIRFVGELLDALIKTALSVKDLMSVAKEKYDLPWSTPDQARRRVSWLICLGMVEYKTVTLIALTPRGRESANRLILGGPASTPTAQVTPPPAIHPSPAIQSLVSNLTPETLKSRHKVLGYIPKGSVGLDAASSLLSLVNAASPSISKVELLAFAEHNFGVSPASFDAALSTLTRSGLLEQTSLGVFEPTTAAQSWLESSNPLDLALILHTRYLFFMEIIPLLTDHSKAPELAKAAYEYFGMSRVDTSGIRTRLQLLKAAGLISERSNWRYQATPQGLEIANLIPLQSATEPPHEDVPDPIKTSSEILDHQAELSSLGFNIIEAGKESENSVKLERLTAQAFQFLGFESRHIGGGGKTDVLATVEDEKRNLFRVIIDAKAAKSGVVSEGAVSFDTLRDHKTQHDADYVVLVGPSFESGRIKKRAEQNNVALITTTELATLLARHSQHPLSAYHYLGLVTGSEKDRRNLEAQWSSVTQKSDILGQVVSVLAEEARDSDDVTHGALTSNEIYLIARSAGTGLRPNPRDIDHALDLLQHPFISSVRPLPGDRTRATSYYLIDRAPLVQKKMLALVRSLDDLEDTI